MNDVVDDVSHELSRQEKRGILLVLSGPSAVGKDTVVRKMLEKYPQMVKMVTTNSRSPREGEKEGFDYYFVSDGEFEKLIAEESFLEWVEYRGHYRGAQKKHVEEALRSGKDVIWHMDVKGVKNIKKKIRSITPYSVFVFLAVKDLETLEKRIIKRATETSNEVTWSMDVAVWEQRQYPDYDYVISNEDGSLDKTVETLSSIVETIRHSTRGFGDSEDSN